MNKDYYNKKTFWNFFTGSVAGIGDVVSTHPIWNIKTLIQTGHNFNDISKMVVQKPSLLYNGVITNMSTTLPITTVRVGFSYVFEEIANSYLPNNNNQYINFFSSFSAGSISSFLSSPIELIRTTKLRNEIYKIKDISTNLHNGANAYNITKSMITEGGITSIFKGVQTVSIRDGLYTAGFITGARYLKSLFSDCTEYPVVNNTSAYITAGFLTSLINHPFDTIKTNQHLLCADSFLLNSPVKSSFLAVCKKIVVEKGCCGFYAGFPMRLLDYCITFIVKASIIEGMENHYNSYFANNDELKKDLLGNHPNDDDSF